MRSWDRRRCSLSVGSAIFAVRRADRQGNRRLTPPCFCSRELAVRDRSVKKDLHIGSAVIYSRQFGPRGVLPKWGQKRGRNAGFQTIYFALWSDRSCAAVVCAELWRNQWHSHRSDRRCHNRGNRHCDEHGHQHRSHCPNERFWQLHGALPVAWPLRRTGRAGRL